MFFVFILWKQTTDEQSNRWPVLEKTCVSGTVEAAPTVYSLSFSLFWIIFSSTSRHHNEFFFYKSPRVMKLHPRVNYTRRLMKLGFIRRRSSTVVSRMTEWHHSAVGSIQWHMNKWWINGQQVNPGLRAKWLLKRCVCAHACVWFIMCFRPEIEIWLNWLTDWFIRHCAPFHANYKTAKPRVLISSLIHCTAIQWC